MLKAFLVRITPFWMSKGMMSLCPLLSFHGSSILNAAIHYNIPPFVQQYSADFPCPLLTLPHPDSFTFVQQYSVDFPCLPPLLYHTLIFLPQPVVLYSHRTIFTKIIKCSSYYTALITTSYSRQKSPRNFSSHRYITCPTPLV